jgi:hypothetical protein
MTDEMIAALAKKGGVVQRKSARSTAKTRCD